MSSVNRQFVLASRPVGLPEESNFKMVETPIAPLNDGEFLARAMYLSVDPYMRGRISGAKSYAAPVEVGGLMVNEVPTYRADNMPYGGVKDSGLGREGVRYTMEEYCERRTVVAWRG